jgi:hypothetical protein
MDQTEDNLLRRFIFPEEDRHLYTTAPWSGGFRWFRSSNVIPIEQLRRERESGRLIPPNGNLHDPAASLLFTGDMAEGRAHLDQGIALYDPTEHRPLATRFGSDVRVAILCYRSLALWLLGYRGRVGSAPAGSGAIDRRC